MASTSMPAAVEYFFALGPVLLDVGLDVDARGRRVLLRLPAAREPLARLGRDGAFSLFRSLFARLGEQFFIFFDAVDSLGLLFFFRFLFDDLFLGLLGLFKGRHVALDELAEFRAAAEALLSQATKVESGHLAAVADHEALLRRRLEHEGFRDDPTGVIP